MNLHICTILVMIGFLAGILFGVAVGSSKEWARWRDDAVKHGHAEFYLDANNERQWRWKDAEKIERKETK